MTREEHIAAIRDAVAAAQDDGFVVGIENDCCGCSGMKLVVADDWDDPTHVIVDSNGEVPV